MTRDRVETLILPEKGSIRRLTPPSSDYETVKDSVAKPP